MKWRQVASVPEKGHPPDRRSGEHQALLNAMDHLPVNIFFPGCRVRILIATVTKVRRLLHKCEYQRVPDFRVETESCLISSTRVHTNGNYGIEMSCRLNSFIISATPKVLQIAALARDVTAERAPTFNR
jgi:hypothetical protein